MIWLNTGISTNDAAISLSFTGTSDTKKPIVAMTRPINRGTVYLYNGKIARYKADKGEEAYREHRKNSCRNYRCLETAKFLRYVENQFFDEGWSLDAAVGHAKANGLFSTKEMVCTKTLYNYVDSPSTSPIQAGTAAP